MISEIVSYDKDGHIERFPLLRKLFVPSVIILVAGLSFGIGRLSVVNNREPVKIEYDSEISDSQFPISSQTSNSNVQTNTAAVSSAVRNIENSKLKIENLTSVVVSKNGSRYHYTYCGSAKQIKEENKITFPTPAAAEAAGYTLAANCKPK